MILAAVFRWAASMRELCKYDEALIRLLRAGCLGNTEMMPALRFLPMKKWPASIITKPSFRRHEFRRRGGYAISDEGRRLSSAIAAQKHIGLRISISHQSRGALAKRTSHWYEQYETSGRYRFMSISYQLRRQYKNIFIRRHFGCFCSAYAEILAHRWRPLS